jgi:hypothetical protein
MAKQMFNVNTNASIILTAKLERLNRSAFPNAVRSTLNDAAFAMKKGNILQSAKKNMTVRNQTFFKKFTGVNKANGYNVNAMSSEVGFINTDKDKKKGQKAMIGMEHNEVGGSDNEGAMYMKQSRVSGSKKRLVRKAARFSKANLAQSKSNAINGKKASFANNAFNSLKEQKPTFIKTKKGNMLVQVIGISSDSSHSKLNIKMIFLMRSRRTNVAHAKATHFNKEAAIKTHKEMDAFYAKNAEREFNKVLR